MAESWQKDLDLIVRILEAWHSYEPPRSAQVPANRADDTRHGYVPVFNPGMARKQRSQFSADVVAGRLGRNPATLGGLSESRRYWRRQPSVIPILTVGVHFRDGALTIHLRVVTFFDEKNDIVDAHGWRLDMADAAPASGEPGPGHHAFPHVQRITGWLPSVHTFHLPGVDPAEVEDAYGPNMNAPSLNESRPAFPLPVCSAPGMLVVGVCIALRREDNRRDPRQRGPSSSGVPRRNACDPASHRALRASRTSPDSSMVTACVPNLPRAPLARIASVVSLFSGAGGLDLGLERAGHRVVQSVRQTGHPRSAFYGLTSLMFLSQTTSCCRMSTHRTTCSLRASHASTSRMRDGSRGSSAHSRASSRRCSASPRRPAHDSFSSSNPPTNLLRLGRGAGIAHIIDSMTALEDLRAYRVLDSRFTGVANVDVGCSCSRHWTLH